MKAALMSLLSASMILSGQANPLTSEMGDPINKGAQRTGPLFRQDTSTWQTVSLDGKGIKFKLPSDWRHDGFDMEAKHETYTIQEIDWNTPNKSLSQEEKIRIFTTVYHNGFLLFGHPMSREEMLGDKLDRVIGVAQTQAPGTSYSEAKTVTIGGVEGVFRLMRSPSQNKEIGPRLYLLWTGYRIYHGKAEEIDISISSAPKGEAFLRKVFSTLEVEQDKDPSRSRN